MLTVKEMNSLKYNVLKIKSKRISRTIQTTELLKTHNLALLSPTRSKPLS